MIFLQTIKTKPWLQFWSLLAIVTSLIWLPAFFIEFPTIGIGHDSQIFAAAINAALREGNTFTQMMPKILAAREDIYSYPYFGILYPFYWTVGLGHGFDYATNLKLDFASVVFHMILANITFALLLKRMGCWPSVAVLFGAFYAYSLHLKMWSSWIWALSGYAWIPLCLLGLWEIICMRNRRLGFVCLGFGFGMIALGTALPLVYAVILIATYAVFCVLKTHPNWRELIRVSALSFAAGIVGLLLGASNLLPTLDQSDLYVRWYTGGASVGSFKPPYEGTLDVILSFSWEGLGQFILPTQWFGVGHSYIGAAVLFFFIYFCVKHYRLNCYYPLIFVAVYFLFDAFGDATFVHRLTYQIPLLSSVRYPLANIYITTTVILILSGIGVTQLLNEKDELSVRRWLVGVSMAVIIASGLMLSKHTALMDGYSQLPVWCLYLTLLSALLLLIFHRAKFSKLILLIVFISYLPQNSMLEHPKIPDTEYLYMRCQDFSDLHDDLRTKRTTLIGTVRLAIEPQVNVKSLPNNCLSELVFSNMHIQSLAMMAGWDVMQIYQSPRLYEEFKLFNKLNRSDVFKNHQLLLNSGISHVLRQTQIEEGSTLNDFYAYSGKIGRLFLYEIKDYTLGFTSLGCLKPNQDGELELINNVGKRSVSQTASVLEQHPEVGCDSLADDVASLDLLNRKGSSLVYQLDQAQAGILISDQVYHESWQGFVDNKPLTPILVDDYRLGFIIPAGRHTFEMSYQPRVLLIGSVLTYLGLLILLISLAWPLLVSKLKQYK